MDMFKKTPRSEENTFLSETMHLEGEISSINKLNIAGLINGNVNSNELRILDTASIEGNIKGTLVEIDGQVHGNIEATNIFLGQNAVIRGNIYFSDTLKTEEGADVDGYIKKTKQSKNKNQTSTDDKTLPGKFTKPTLVKNTEKEVV